MMIGMKSIGAAVLFSLLVACASTAPMPTESEYLRTSVAAFAISRETKAARYVLELDVLKEIEGPLEINIVYENPVSPDEPLEEASELSPGQERLTLRSEPLPGVRNGATYSVTIVGTNAEGAQVFRHVQPIKFILPPGL